MIDDQDKPYTRQDLEELGAKWAEKLLAAEKREDRWIKDAESAESAYLCDPENGPVPRFNILHSNVETIIPAIYNSTPAPDIRPRHDRVTQGADGQDPVKWFADALERAISTQIDDDKLNMEIEALAQDVEVAGRGVTRIRFDFDEREIETQAFDPETGETVIGVETTPINERVVFENVSWRNYREGPATRWDGVPWVAYRYEVTKEEAERLTDEDVKGAYDGPIFSKDAETLDCALWEIWCKETGKVYFMIEDQNKIIAVKDDPLGLDGFFPQPDTVQPIKGTGRRTPVCPYVVYQKLAEELDTATARINRIMSGLKVRGLIAGDASIETIVSNLDDNELAPVPSLEGLMATGKLNDRIMWWPVDQAIAVLVQLYQQREQTKQAIYEITGISDIVRGASDPRETAAAQKVKTQWGSQRVKRRQRMIQSHVRDLFVLSAEVISKLFSPQGFLQAAGVDNNPAGMQMLGQLDHYRIDIESDSTIRADLDKQRAEMAGFLEATGGFFQMAGPLAKEQPQSLPALLEIYGAFAKSFQLGKSAEDALDQLSQMAKQQAAQPQPNPEAEKMKAEAAFKQQELQLKAQEMQMRMGEAQAKAQTEQQKNAIDMQKSQAELLIKRADLQLKAQDLGIKRDDQHLRELQAEIDALFRAEELDVEQEQKRPVALG